MGVSYYSLNLLETKAPTYLAMLSQNFRGDLACPLDQLDDGTISKLWANITEGLKSYETRIRIT